MRKPIIAGNWKMNKTISDAVKFVEELKPMASDSQCEVVICPSFVCLSSVIEAARGSNIKVGAQNMHFEENGAFTGEVSPEMISKMGVQYVIIGHSERREYFNETDETVNKKIIKAFEHNLIPILCVGETLKERENDITKEVIGRQIKLDMAGLKSGDVKNMVIAYEPIWAIGTGKTATAEDANNTISYIRDVICSLFGQDSANSVRILYGGSVKSSTIKEQMSMEHIDGGLVGGASLKADEFSKIICFEK